MDYFNYDLELCANDDLYQLYYDDMIDRETLLKYVK